MHRHVPTPITVPVNPPYKNPLHKKPNVYSSLHNQTLNAVKGNAHRKPDFIPSFGDGDSYTQDAGYQRAHPSSATAESSSSREKAVQIRAQDRTSNNGNTEQIRRDKLAAEKLAKKRGKEVLEKETEKKSQEHKRVNTIAKMKGKSDPWKGTKGGNDQVKIKGKGKATSEDEEEQEDIENFSSDDKNGNGKRPAGSSHGPASKQLVLGKVTPPKPKFVPVLLVFDDEKILSFEENQARLAAEESDDSEPCSDDSSDEEIVEVAKKSSSPPIPANSKYYTYDGSSDNEFAELEKAEAKRIANGGVPDALLEPEKIIDTSIALCPFCAGVLPPNLSDHSKRTLEFLLARPDIIKFPTKANPGGMRLGLAVTAAFCGSHKEEVGVIPEGILAGYPTEIDFDSLAGRIEGFSDYFTLIIYGEQESRYLPRAMEDWKKLNNGKGTLLDEIGTTDMEEPGYYGLLGFAAIFNSLSKTYLDESFPTITAEVATPFSPNFYLRRILVPETAICLIAEDLNISKEAAEIIRKASAGFGKAFYKVTAADLEELERSLQKQNLEEERKQNLLLLPKKKKKLSKGEVEPGQLKLGFTTVATAPARKPKKAKVAPSSPLNSSPPAATIVKKRLPKKMAEAAAAAAAALEAKKASPKGKSKPKAKAKSKRTIEISSDPPNL